MEESSENKGIVINRLKSDLNKLRSREGYIKAGHPNYDWLFGRDALITAWELLPVEPGIARDTLIHLANHQSYEDDTLKDAEPGKILHEARPLNKQDLPNEPLIAGWKWPYYGSIDSTPLFLILAGKYLEQTGDEVTTGKLWQAIEMGIEWMVKYGDKDGDGLLEYERRNPNGLFHQGWKDSFGDIVGIKTPVAVVEVQGYAYAAFQEYFKMCKTMKCEFAKEAAEKAKLLKENFHKAFWMEDEKYYAFALFGDKSQKRQITSNPGHLLGTGLLTHEQEEAVVKRLMQLDMLTPFGVRTLSSKDPDFDPTSYHKGPIWPHDNWIIIQGMREAGFEKEAEEVKNRILRAVKILGFEPESFTLSEDEEKPLEITKIVTEQGASPNKIQAWALGAILNLLSEQSDTIKADA